jgi:hypothetical protein
MGVRDEHEHTRRHVMKIRTALALAALAVTPAFAAESATAPSASDEAMTAVEKSTVESLQKEIATLQQAVEQVRKASAERAVLQAQREADQTSHPLWP